MHSARTLSRQLRNIGPAMAAAMIAAGIRSPDALRRLGAYEAYRRMYPDGDRYGDFNAAYLYALEGAIRDCDITALPETVKAECRDAAKALQARRRSNRE